MSRSAAARLDAVVVGGGHNGLVCAAYLAAGGMRVRVIERRAIVGGAAVTEEFHPGFHNSTLSYTVSLLAPRVIRDLRLAERGVRIVERPFANFLPLAGGRYLSLGGGLAATQADVARFSQRDAQRLPAYYAMLDRAARLVRPLLLATPPNGADIGFGDVLRAIALGGRLHALDTPTRRDLVDLFAKSAGDLLDAWFENDALKAALGFDAVVGTYASPYAPGSAYMLLHHALGEVNGKRGVWGHAIGGMGAISDAIADEARSRGVAITTGVAVERVIVEGGRALGVVLAGGEEVRARAVVANVGPKLLFTRLVDPSALDADFRARIERLRLGSGAFRMNVALAALPDFSALPGAPRDHHRSGIVIAPSLGYMDRAYQDARAHGWSRAPLVEMLIPSTVDDSLAPPGRHVASLFCQQFAPVLPDGRSWDDERERAADAIIATVNEYAPNFAASVIARWSLSPLDLEREYGLAGGDIFHAAHGLDQIFSTRPVLGHADYRMPIERLYLCGAGAHPGGGVSGAPGYNAAREILRDGRRGRLR